MKYLGNTGLAKLIALINEKFAPLNSPAITGTPTAPTAAAGTNTTQLATTAFVQNALSDIASSYALKASPAFTGVPTAPTAASGTNTTQLATTAFVQSALSNIVPIIISNDSTMPNSVNNNGVWFQLTGDTSITNGESVGY